MIPFGDERGSTVIQLHKCRHTPNEKRTRMQKIHGVSMKPSKWGGAVYDTREFPRIPGVS